MNNTTADQFATLVMSMSDVRTHDKGAFTVSIGTTPDGRRIAAISDVLGGYHIIDRTLFE